MVIYADDLYLTKKTEKRLSKIKQSIKTRSGMLGTVVIALSSNDNDVFELIPCFMFKTKIYSKIDLFVCGIAENKEAAYDLIEKMISEYLVNGRGFSMKEYYNKKYNR